MKININIFNDSKKDSVSNGIVFCCFVVVMDGEWVICEEIGNLDCVSGLLLILRFCKRCMMVFYGFFFFLMFFMV